MKETYILSDLDHYWQRAIKMTEEQANVIEWFLGVTDVDYVIEKASEIKEEVE